jgi:hypothetical protein
VFTGSKSGSDRLVAYQAKIRPYSGTGVAPDYVSPVCQQKLGMMYRKAQGAFGG